MSDIYQKLWPSETRRCDAYRDAYYELYVLACTPGLTDTERDARVQKIDDKLEPARKENSESSRQAGEE